MMKNSDSKANPKAQPGSLQRLVRGRRRWRSSYEKPRRRGWYETRARDGRWNGETRWRAWGRGMWWIPLGGPNAEGGWLSSPMGLYQWRGPAHDIMKPPPNDETHTRRADGVGLPTETQSRRCVQ